MFLQRFHNLDFYIFKIIFLKVVDAFCLQKVFSELCHLFRKRFYIFEKFRSFQNLFIIFLRFFYSLKFCICRSLELSIFQSFSKLFSQVSCSFSKISIFFDLPLYKFINFLTHTWNYRQNFVVTHVSKESFSSNFVFNLLCATGLLLVFQPIPKTELRFFEPFF